MNQFSRLSDVELPFACSSSRPRKDGLFKLFMTDEEIEEGQRHYDDVYKEIDRRRHLTVMNRYAEYLEAKTI